MDTDALADLVAADLRRNLESRAPQLHDVYGVCLFADDFNGGFLASVATEAEFDRMRRLPAYASNPEAALRKWGGLRWSIGDWHRFPDDDFVTHATESALKPLRIRLTDPSLSETEYEDCCGTWREVAFKVFDRCEPLAHLTTTPEAISFVNFPDLTVDQEMETMRRTVPVERLRALFPDLHVPG